MGWLAAGTFLFFRTVDIAKLKGEQSALCSAIGKMASVIGDDLLEAQRALLLGQPAQWFGELKIAAAERALNRYEKALSCVSIAEGKSSVVLQRQWTQWRSAADCDARAVHEYVLCAAAGQDSQVHVNDAASTATTAAAAAAAGDDGGAGVATKYSDAAEWFASAAQATGMEKSAR